jgi:hypothetical protein
MFSALVVGRWTKNPNGINVAVDTLKESVEGQVEIQPRLFTICDDIQAGFILIMDGGDDRILLQLLNFIASEFIQIPAGKLKPGRKWITSDHSCT